MPAPSKLTDTEQAHVDAGRCACGCRKPLATKTQSKWTQTPWCKTHQPGRAPTPDELAQLRWNSPCAEEGCEARRIGFNVKYKVPYGRYASRAHSQRMHRRRIRDGRHRSRPERKRQKALQRADELDRQAAEEERRAQSAADSAKRLRRQAKAIRVKNSQSDLPLPTAKAAK